VFGGAALHIELEGGAMLAGVVGENAALAIYALLEQFPLVGLSGPLAMLLVAVFFITSSDSGSFVVDMLASGGNPDPPVVQRVFWASLEGVIAITWLFTGCLAALQAGAVSLGLPFAFLLLAVAYSLLRQLRSELRARDGAGSGYHHAR